MASPESENQMSAAVAREHFAEVVNRVAYGRERIVLSRRGKAVAAMLANPGDMMDYLEVVGLGKKIGNRSKPYIAIPTTAGTGSEVTRNAVIAVPEKRVKVSMRSPFMLPQLALVDPELTHSMPPALTAATGLDALTQLLEAFVSRSANPLTDGICREGLACAGRALGR